MSRARVSGEFIAGSSCQLMVVVREVPGTIGGVLFVPPFAEETNKCRSMMTATAVALGEAGINSVLVDLSGTGDSEGEFCAVDWLHWQQDLRTAVHYCAGRGWSIQASVAIRLGCRLLADAVNAMILPPLARTVLWQPQWDGSRARAQFLRLRTAANLGGQDKKESQADVEGQLRGVGMVEVAGYELGRQLSENLKALPRIERVPAGLGDVSWFELLADEQQIVPDAAARLAGMSREGSRTVAIESFVGAPFWAATEIERHEGIVNATVAALSGPANR